MQYEVNSGLVADQVSAADEERTKRAFVGFLSSVLGVDQTMTSADGQVGNATGQYVIADNRNGNYSTLGQPVSNQNAGMSIAGVPLGLILLAGVAFALLSK